MRGPPTVFVSHSHVDKKVARRLVRRFRAQGIKVWIDERELRIGAKLTSSICQQIADANALLVIVSQASAESKWVEMELEHARERDKTIIPFFVEPLADHPRFRDILGVDATSLPALDDVVQVLIRDLFRSLDLEAPPVDPAVLEEGLRELARDEPDLAPLIIGCLESDGLHGENCDTVYNAHFHALDESLNALFDLRPNSALAYHAAGGFCKVGAGARALSLWIAATGDGDLPLVSAVGCTLAPALIPTAIRLLAACNPPNNHALYMFIDRNAAQLSHEQRRSVIRLVTWPVRTDTGRLGDVLGWVASRHFSEAAEIRQMWSRWVSAGAFDGTPNSPRDLARYLNDAHREGLSGWEHVHEALRSHVRGFLRSRDRNQVFVALDHIMAAADQGASVLPSLLHEAKGVTGTAEWDDWRVRDPKTAAWTGWHVHTIVEEAEGDRNWLRAWNQAEQVFSFEEERRRILNRAEKPEGETLP